MTEIDYENWEPIIGLEIHVQLNTRTKLFSKAPNSFGDEPNTNISYVDTGQPGTLPVLNQEAVRKAVMFGCAINAEIPFFSKFDRKSYFYPDSPRNYQITQFDQPIIKSGRVIADVEGKTKTFYVNRAHLEDDAGMLKHFQDFAGVDYNRAGVPLLEIVSEPCMFSPKEAVAYATTIKAIMHYIGASNCNMEEGSLRVDVNISVRKKGETSLRNKVEIKNMNSFSFMEIALEAEIRRQIREYTLRAEEDPQFVIPSSTFRFDPEKKEAVLMRTKEAAADYRYFPEPDLPPLLLSEEYIAAIKSNLPELPHERFERYIAQLQLSEYNASLLVADKQLSDFFELGLKNCKNPKALCNWITVEFVGRIKDSGLTLPKFGIPAENIAELVNLIENHTVTGKIAKSVADEMVKNRNKSPKTIIEENADFQPLSDVAAIERLVDRVLQDNPESITAFHAGKDKAYHFLFGQVMKLCKGKASPHVVKDLLTKKLESL